LLYTKLEGRQLKLPVQLGRAAAEPPEPDLEPFYRRLIELLSDPVFHEGTWRLIEPKAAWPGNSSHVNHLPSTHRASALRKGVESVIFRMEKAQDVR
jgi:hypothetical protein